MSWLQPPDFIDEVAASEAWAPVDKDQWERIQTVLHELGVTRLRQHGGGLLSADHSELGFVSVDVAQNAGAFKPTIDAANRLAHEVRRRLRDRPS